MATSKSSSALPAINDIKITAKITNKVVNSKDPKQQVLQSITKLLQRNNGCLRLHDIHENLLKEVAKSCDIFQYSSDGLLQFLSNILTYEPDLFQGCIIDGNVVYLIPVFGKKKLKSFLKEAKSVIIYDEHLLENVSLKTHKKLDDVLLAKVIISLISILKTEPNGLSLKKLHDKLVKDREEELKGTDLETSLESFKKFIVDHPLEFSLFANNTVKCLVNDHSDLVSKAVLAVKMTVLFKGGVINAKNLPGHFSSFPDVRQVTGGSFESMKNFILEHQDVFILESNDDVRIRCQFEETRSPKTEDSANTKPENSKFTPNLNNSLYSVRSVVVAIYNKFGLIQFGCKNEEHIYFDTLSVVPPKPSSPVEQIDNLITVFKMGDIVDCLFIEHDGDNKAKYKAYLVWKNPVGTDNGLGLTPIVELPYKILMGSATVSFLDGDIGSCKIVKEHQVSLIELEPKSKIDVSSVGFHLGWAIKLNTLKKPLQLGSVINFIARPQLRANGSLSSHWVAVCVWEKLTEHQLENLETPKTERVVKAEVRDLTTDGGLLSFGSDHWAQRAAFQWDKLHNNNAEFLTITVGDVFWCVISEAQSILGSTKWRISELAAYNLSDNDIPPLKFRRLPLETFDISSLTISRPETKNALEFEETNKSVDLMDLAAVIDNPLLDFSRLSLSNSNLGSGLVGNRTEMKDLGPIVVENGLGMIISRDVYGGMIEGDDGVVVYFDAHSFYMQGRPMTHFTLPDRTTVHFEARSNPDDKNNLIAKKVWIGQKPY